MRRNRRIRPLLALGLSTAAVLVISGVAMFAAPAPVAASNGNLDQCANGSTAATPCTNAGGNSGWVNGNLGASKSLYYEAQSIPYRLAFSNLSTGSGNVHTTTIYYDTTKAYKHAIDYLTNWNANVAAGSDPSTDVLGSMPTPGTWPIPIDPNVGASIQNHTPLVGTQYFDLYGGTITGVSAYSLSTQNNGDSTTSITISFWLDPAYSGSGVLAWGGHIAARADWGLNNAAVNISGSPYHTFVNSIDGSSIGNQDLQLSAQAVVFPGFIHIVKDTTGGDATFGYTASPTPLANFSITTSSGVGEQDFNTITNFQTYTVNETTVPSHWAFGTLNCVVASANGGTQTVNGAQATIVLKEGEEVTCTYTNNHVMNSPSIATKLSASSVAIGATLNDTATLTGATSDAGGTVTYTVYTDNACSAGAQAAGTVNVSSGVVPASNGIKFTSAGTWYWQAVYTGDGNNNGATSVCTDETLVVNPNSPTLPTTPSAGGAIGTVLNDTATVTGGSSPTGSVTFNLYGPNDATCSNAAIYTQTVTLSGGSATTSPGFTTLGAGTYEWTASYGGDDNNKAATSGCGDEAVTIDKNSPTIATLLSATTGTVGDTVNDTATLTNATSNAGGTVTYTVYTDSDCSLGARAAGTVNVTNGDVPDSNGLPFGTVGTYYWQAVYSGDDNNNGASSVCTDEPLVINPAPNPLLGLTKIDDLNPSKYNAVGQVVTYTITATNDGNVTLHNVTVSDNPSLDSFSCNPSIPAASLAPGDSIVCTGTHTISQADLDAGSFKDTASATSTEADAPDAPDTILGAQGPALGLTKTTTTTSYSVVGDTINYKYVLKNIGTVTLTGPFTVTDNKFANPIDCGTGSLAPGATVTCTATYTVTAADVGALTVVNTAIGHAFFGSLAVDSNPASVTVPIQQVQGETLVPTNSPTPPVTTTSGSGSGPTSTPIFALLIGLAFAALGLLAVQAQRRALHRRSPSPRCRAGARDGRIPTPPTGRFHGPSVFGVG
jgi:hypothetical protein